MAQRLKLKVIDKDDMGRTYGYRAEDYLTVRAFNNSMTGGVTFRVFRSGKEITLRDIDYPHDMSKKQERYVAEALHFTYKHMKRN